MKRIGIAGATGLVGETLVRLVEPEKSGVKEVRLFASEKSAGRKLAFRDAELEVRTLDPDGFKGLDIAFSCLEADLAAKVVPKIARHCPVIDKSSRFRLDKDVPLVVPEVNPEAVKSHKNIIANPNCTTIPLCVAVAVLHLEFGLEAITAASYQSISGAGRDALDQLRYETEFVALGEKPDTTASPLPVQIADNLIPEIGPLDRDGHSEEESKLVNESKKILGLPDLRINITCVRVPITIGHCLAVYCRFREPANPKKARAVLDRAPGIRLAGETELVTPAGIRHQDHVYVSRVRPGAEPEELNLWVATDNLRKGAALNALQIAALLFQEEE